MKKFDFGIWMCVWQLMVDLLCVLVLQEGYNFIVLFDVCILCLDCVLVCMQVLYDLGIVIVGQGYKCGYFGNQVYLYDEQYYFVVVVLVFFMMEIEVMVEWFLLVIYLYLDFWFVVELMIQID